MLWEAVGYFLAALVCAFLLGRFAEDDGDGGVWPPAEMAIAWPMLLLMLVFVPLLLLCRWVGTLGKRGRSARPSR